MSDTLFDMAPYKSEATQSYRPDWRDTTGTDPAWDVPTFGSNDKEPDGDSPTEWQSASEFSLTLPSSQHVQVKFIPGLVGERRMHQFDFTGPISSTGFKAHFVLAVEAEKFPHPRDYAQAYAQELVAQMESKQCQSKRTKRTLKVKEVEVPHRQTTDNNDFTLEITMAQSNTPELKNTPAEVIEELSPEEESDRQRLELLVERAFYQAGAALRVLRDKRLYRSSHKTFEQYCQDRFGYNRISAHYKITASEVFENLLTFSEQILPTKETQVRPLAKLDPQEQHLVWQQAVERAGGKIPSERIVKDAVLRHKGIVERLKEKNPSPPEFVLGDVVEIKPTSHSPLRPFARMWGIIERVCSFSYTVRLGIARETQQCRAEEMTRVDDEYTADIKVVSQRMAALVQFELEPVEYAILEFLQRSKCFTPTQLQLLEWLEQKHLDA